MIFSFKFYNVDFSILKEGVVPPPIVTNSLKIKLTVVEFIVEVDWAIVHINLLIFGFV